MNSLCQSTLPYKLEFKFTQTIKDACENRPTGAKYLYLWNISYKLNIFKTILVMIVKDYFHALTNFVLMMIFVMIFYKLTYISLAVNMSYCCYSTSQHNHLDIHLDTLHWGGHIVHSLYIACYNFLCSSFHNVLADTLYKDECIRSKFCKHQLISFSYELTSLLVMRLNYWTQNKFLCSRVYGHLSVNLLLLQSL